MTKSTLINTLFLLLTLYSSLYSSSTKKIHLARTQDAEKHFGLIIEQMIQSDTISQSAASKLMQIIKEAHLEKNSFFSQVDEFFQQENLPPTIIEILRKSWEDSFGIILRQFPIVHDASKWSEKFQQIKSNYSLVKRFRAAIYEQTKSAFINGYVMNCSENKIHAPSEDEINQMQKKSFLVKQLAKLAKSGPYSETEVLVVDADTIELTKRLINNGYHPVALNFANKNKAGGGVTRGAKAQEEWLFRRSSYFLALDIRYNSYLHEALDGKYKIPEFGAIYSPHVQIFRGPESKGYHFIPPFKVDLIASAAYNLSKNSGDAPSNFQDYLNGMCEKIRTILRLSVETNHDSVVLGAFGCGAFKNDPNVVANLFNEVIHEEEFRGQFKIIAFGIPNDTQNKNYKTFSKILDKQFITGYNDID